MYDPSAPTFEMNGSSCVTEMPTSAWFQPRESPKLLHPIDSGFSRRSLLHKIRAMPALDPRHSTAQQSSKSLSNITASGNIIPSVGRRASKTDDAYSVLNPGTRCTSTASSVRNRQSDGEACTIFVETDILRETSDSFGSSTESSCVETVISSSPRPRSPDLSKPLPALPQRKSLNSKRSSPLIPTLDDIEMSPTETSSSRFSSATSGGHRLSSRTSASYPDAKIDESVPTQMSLDGGWTVHDIYKQFHSRCKPPFANTRPTNIDMMLAGDASSEDLASREGLRSPYLTTNTVSPNTLALTAASPVSDVVSPSSPDSGLFSPFSYMLPPVSPSAEFVLPSSNVGLLAAETREGQNLGTIELHEDAASLWSSVSPSPSGPAPKEFKHTRSATNTSELGLPIQRPVLQTVVYPAYQAQCTADDVSHRHMHPFNDGYQLEGLSAPFNCTQPNFLITESSGLADSVHLSRIDELQESEVPSSMMDTITTQVATFSPWGPGFSPSVSNSAALVRNFSAESSFVNGSLETVREESPVPTFQPIDMNSDDHTLHKFPLPVGGSGPHSLVNSLYPSEERPDAALWSRRQMNVPPLNLSRSKISSAEKSGESIHRHRRSKATHRSLSPNLVSTQSQSREGQRNISEIVDPEWDVASAHQCQLDLTTALSSPSSTNTEPHCFDHRSLLVTHSPPKQEQVKKLERLIGVGDEDLMQRLESIPELRLRCNRQAPQALLEKAILTLRECFRGRLPHVFEDIFTFIRVAFAIAFLLSDQQSFYDLDAFHEDALKWQHALSDHEDKRLFLKAMNCWYYLPKSHSNALLNNSRQTNVDSIYLREPLDCSHQTDLLDVLRKSTVFKACIGFIDGKSILTPPKAYDPQSDCFVGFEEADICERNARFPVEALQLSTHTREHLIKHITFPLQHERGIEALQRILIDTELQIDRGLLRNTREVEVTLKTSARVRFKTSSSAASCLADRF